MFDFVHPDDREAVRKRIREHARDFTNVRQNETRLIGLNGKEACTEVMACSHHLPRTSLDASGLS